jgi:two-component system response regulator YesN
VYKVMLADDDYPVIECLKQTIPWEELGLELVGIAEDGLSALEQAKKNMPDLLITDISMPGLDGIQLIDELKKLSPGIRTVILSCHDDFQYTRQAVKLHVQDYVLKESMEFEEIVDILRELINQLDEDLKEARRNQGMIRLVKQNQFALKENMISKLLGSPVLDELEWHEKMKEFGVDFAARSYIPIVCYINRYSRQFERFKSEEVLVYTISNIVEEMLGQQKQAVCFRLNPKELLLMFPDSGPHDPAAEIVARSLKEIQLAAQTYIRMDLSFIISEHCCQNIKELKREINELMATADQRFYLPEPVVAEMSKVNIPYAQEDIFQHYGEVSDEFGSLLLEENTEQADQTVAKWFRLFGRCRYHPEDVKSFILRLVMDQQVKVRSSARHFDFKQSKEMVHQEILAAESIFELEDWLKRFWKSLISSVAEMSKRSRRMEIINAQKYVSKHLDQKISLEEVADYLHLNPAYFSRLFKKETKESFIGYVTRIKMEKAREWLETNHKSLEEIPYELGYSNKSYFNKCFKATFGLAPSQIGRNIGSMQGR